MKTSFILLTAATLLAAKSGPTQQKFKETKKGIYTLIEQKGGPTLGYSPASGVKTLTVGGFKFKDLNRNGKLDKYEDWRLSFNERAADLASQLSDEEIAGLMLYSAHQQIPAKSTGYGASTYNGKPFEESGMKPSVLSDAQKKFHAKQSTSTRPVKELRAFRKINLKAGEKQTVNFTLTPEDLKYFNHDLQYVCEPGSYDIMVGDNSENVQTAELKVL